jgi:cell wall-associated NlpC family hydrolase
MRLTTHSPRRRFAAVFTVCSVSAIAILSAFASAGAAPIDDKRAQAAALEAQISANAEKLSRLNELLMGVQGRLDIAKAQIADAEAALASAKAETDRLTALVRQRAVSAYRSRSTGHTAGMFEGNTDSVVSREQYSKAADQRDNHLLDSLDAARQDLAVRRHRAESARQTAQAQKNKIADLKAKFEAAQAERQRLLANVKGEIAALVRQQEEARRARELPQNFDVGSLPAPSGNAGPAVSYARAQVGKPYCYAGTGPGCFDCSGLTLSAWAQAGVSLPHNSESQYNGYPHVPMNMLAPGDILWNPGHVGIYVGGGTAVHATHEGDFVRYIGASYFQGASRPG